jgi:SAM-dependent methyltransferase
MADWSEGYVADVEYTHGYYHELNPLRIKLAFLRAGLACPDIGYACELGFGQGISTNIHAAAAVAKWFGTDFNPSQAAFARELAEYSGSGAKLYDEAFEDFAKRPDLPDFDFIALHGIWSWVSEPNRHIIVDFIRRKLKVGGVLYISYNTLPGWSSFAPMRHLLTAHASSQGAEGGGLVNQISEALAFGKQLLATKPGYSAANPLVAARFDQLDKQDKHYLAHEYFNRDWHPMHFGTMAAWLDSAKLQYACSAQYTDHFDHLNMNAEQKEFMKKIPDRMFRETVRDFMVNQNFRKDYWVKGIRQLSLLDAAEQAGQVRVVLTKHRPDVPYSNQVGNITASLNEAVYAPLLNLLADYKPRTLAEITQALEQHGIKLPTVIEAVMILCGFGHVTQAQNDEDIAHSTLSCKRLNEYIQSKARGSGDLIYLASPVTGSGITLGRFAILFAKGVSEGIEGPQALATYVWKLLQAQGQLLMRNGERILDPQDNVAELLKFANEFVEKQEPVLRALKIIN